MNQQQLTEILSGYNNDPTRLMDILLSIQEKAGYISEDLFRPLASALGISAADVEQTVSFYHFFRTEPPAEVNIYLNNSAVADMYGRREVMAAFERAAGCSFGSISADKKIALYHTSCIGMSDQEPAAIINNKIFTFLTPEAAESIVASVRAGRSVEEIYEDYQKGDGRNASEELSSMVRNHIRRSGPVLDTAYTQGDGLRKAFAAGPENTIAEIKKSGLRGRGGAGFPTGLKWEFCRNAKGEKHYVFCNADEGEPGTFKDRVILTEVPELLFEGMALAGYAVGAEEGILYIRYEYLYMKKFLESVLSSMKQKGLIGENILGSGFNFHIRIQYGAGAYVCGEESALIESAEGKRGEPRDRPPFPVERGYLGQPTVVNNVETLCSAVKIMINGADWYKSMGTSDSSGTKLLSISGDCEKPGIYEVEWGLTVQEVLDMAGAAPDTFAVQVGGPSGTLIGRSEFGRRLSFSDLATGGSLIIISEKRNLLKDIVENFTEFFMEESCGSCVPCRSVPPILKRKLDVILAGKGTKSDLRDLENWTAVMKLNRCGLGQTAANPVIYSLKNFRYLYENLVSEDSLFSKEFDIEKATAQAAKATGRNPVRH